MEEEECQGRFWILDFGYVGCSSEMKEVEVGCERVGKGWVEGRLLSEMDMEVKTNVYLRS